MLFLQLIKLAKRHIITHQAGGKAAPIRSLELMDMSKGLLPFELTTGQCNSLSEILGDLSKSLPMLRLLQGDVGSGKTVVAFLAMLAAVGSGANIPDLLFSLCP